MVKLICSTSKESAQGYVACVVAVVGAIQKKESTRAMPMPILFSSRKNLWSDFVALSPLKT